jgi:hypothetical protein
LEPATELLQGFLTVFVNVLPATSGDESDSYFFAYDHKWDLQDNATEGFAAVDGENDSFDGANVLRLGPNGGSLTAFAPSSLDYADLTWLTPLFGQADGLVAAAVVPVSSDFGQDPNTSDQAYLAPGKENRLQQQLDLTGAVGTVTLTWDHAYRIPDDEDFSVPNEEYRVVLRSTSGQILTTLFSETNGTSSRTSESSDITSFAGQVVVLSFEILNSQQSNSESQYNDTFVDDVSVMDGNSTEFVTNGDFETGDLTGWTQFVEPLSQHVRTNSQTIAGVDVVRYVYVDPTTNWARWFDQFTNNTASSVTIDVQLSLNLGHDSGSTYFIGSGGTGLVFASSDGTPHDDDVAAVYGNGTGTPVDGNGTTLIDYTITIPAGETRSILSFLLQSNQQSNGSQPTALLQQAETMSNTVLNSPQLLRGLTQAQFDSIANF